jgi:hypothetical protein
VKQQTTGPSKIKKYAESLGVEFSYKFSGHQYSIECWSPEGKRWSATSTHFYALEGDGYYTTPNWQLTLDDLREQVAGGFEDCDDPECDVCPGKPSVQAKEAGRQVPRAFHSRSN